MSAIDEPETWRDLSVYQREIHRSLMEIQTIYLDSRPKLIRSPLRREQPIVNAQLDLLSGDALKWLLVAEFKCCQLRQRTMQFVLDRLKASYSYWIDPTRSGKQRSIHKPDYASVALWTMTNVKITPQPHCRLQAFYKSWSYMFRAFKWNGGIRTHVKGCHLWSFTAPALRWWSSCIRRSYYWLGVWLSGGKIGAAHLGPWCNVQEIELWKLWGLSVHQVSDCITFSSHECLP